MIFGFKGENSKLKSLYKELGLKEVSPKNITELEEVIKGSDGTQVIVTYNDVVAFENPTADLVEKRIDILKLAAKSKKNLFLGLTKVDPSIDRLNIDVAICTETKTNDMKIIEDIFEFCNTDIAYSGKLKADQYAVKLGNEERATAKSVSEIKKLAK